MAAASLFSRELGALRDQSGLGLGGSQPIGQCPATDEVAEDCRRSAVNGGSAGRAPLGRESSRGGFVMRIFRRRPAGADANEIAVGATLHSGASATAIISAI